MISWNYFLTLVFDDEICIYEKENIIFTAIIHSCKEKINILSSRISVVAKKLEIVILYIYSTVCALDKFLIKSFIIFIMKLTEMNEGDEKKSNLKCAYK